MHQLVQRFRGILVAYVFGGLTNFSLSLVSLSAEPAFAAHCTVVRNLSLELLVEPFYSLKLVMTLSLCCPKMLPARFSPSFGSWSCALTYPTSTLV